MGEGQRRFRRGLGNRSCVGSSLASLSPGEQLMKRAEETEKQRRAGWVEGRLGYGCAGLWMLRLGVSILSAASRESV